MHLYSRQQVAGVGGHVHEGVGAIFQNLVIPRPHVKQFHMDESRIRFHVLQCGLKGLQILAV